MVPILFIAAAAAPLAAAQPILVTASRAPVLEDDIGVSVTIFDEQLIEGLGEAQAVDLLRLSPGVSVSTSGSRGTQAQLRIRGSEANHALLFVDGIAFNDPAAGNEARFETLTGDGLGRVEIIRGPQSALWGSEAIGGVIALASPDPLAGTRYSALGEYGGFDSARGAAAATLTGDDVGATLTGSHARSDGIDIVGGGAGDLDGYRNTTLGLLAIARPGSNGEFGVAARYIDARSEFDGFDPFSFARADTLDSSATETAAIRGWAGLGIDPTMPSAIRTEAQYLTSNNRNFLDADPLNRTQADRFQLSIQGESRLVVGGTRHVLIAASEWQEEGFAARDQQYFGATNQDRSRSRAAYIGEWRARWGEMFGTDIAVRHDNFSAFANATTFRAAGHAELGGGFGLNASYGEGIAQPTFFDLFGFFPGSFVGNPALEVERARSVEIGARWRSRDIAFSITGFQAELRGEIVSVFDPTTFLSSTANASGESDRRGVEIAIEATPLPGLTLIANYTYLDAEDQQVSGGVQLREIRRPKHGANVAIAWQTGRWHMGGSAAWVGARTDTDFDLFPARTVRLDDYLLVSARIGYEIVPGIEIYGRATNLLDEEYQDVVGYKTPGRALYAGLRLALGD